MREFIVLSAILALTGCETPDESAPVQVVIEEPGQIADPGTTVMTVNGYEVGRKETDQVFRNIGVPDSELDKVTMSPMGFHILEDFALATAMYRMAIDEKLYEDPEVQLQLAFAQRQVLTRAMQQKLASDAVTDAEIASWIAANDERLSLPQARARQILVPSENYAKDLMERIEGGEEFAAVARDHSTDESTNKIGGELGWFSESDFPDIGGAVFGHPEGSLIGPIESPRGFYVVEVLGRRGGTPDDERRQIARMMLEKQAALDTRKQVRGSMDVQYNKPGDATHLPSNHPPTGDAAEGEGAEGAEGAGAAPAEGATEGDGH